MTSPDLSGGAAAGEGPRPGRSPIGDLISRRRASAPPATLRLPSPTPRRIGARKSFSSPPRAQCVLLAAYNTR
ncbi:hypothetical protein U9M48_005235 [Paspalum notatum var. saurae]|uniref:Uncharacterized protein n=1 Tax=Paspalum notatum var. saurae TaxID=547442 RepID=A0AAQ3PQE5_PASNO